MKPLKISTITLLLSFSLLLLPLLSLADEYPDVVGKVSSTTIQENESIMEVARRTTLGFENLVNANPHIDPWIPPQGAEIVLPKQTVLPAGFVQGLTINLAEMRLFVLLPDNPAVRIFPLGIGREGRNTPEGLFRVSNKKVNPIWRVPPGLREDDHTLPKLVQPGPDNPLGDHWLGLSAPGYGIHGTNRPLGVGRRISYGCLRMYPEQVAELYPWVAVGTPVRIVYQPVKAGWLDNQLLLEVHPDYRGEGNDLFQQAMDAISLAGGGADVDYLRVRAVVAKQNGLPERIGLRANSKGELD